MHHCSDGHRAEAPCSSSARTDGQSQAPRLGEYVRDAAVVLTEAFKRVRRNLRTETDAGVAHDQSHVCSVCWRGRARTRFRHEAAGRISADGAFDPMSLQTSGRRAHRPVTAQMA